MASGDSDADRWWHGGVFYQIYPRSFADSNDDGVGDLPGIIAKLDHLARLGISGVWLSPVTCSPNRDWGYDVSDYRDIDPAYGTLDDLDTLVREAGRRGIRVLMDLVPNHTSDQHAWFVDALSGRDAAHRDYYVWADPEPDGSPPNNWMSIFGGPAWQLDEASGQYFLHNFEAAQPDLDWWNEDVRREFDDIVRFWWDRGVAGFRIDVCNMMIKDRDLRDNPPATEDDPLDQQFMGVRAVYNTDRPEANDILRRWRAIADTYDPERLLIGETNVEQLTTLMQFYGTGRDELHGGFNFVFINAPFEAAALRTVVEGTEALIPHDGWPIWTASNHDVSRLATRWAGGDPAKVKVALLILLTLRGTPFLYQGDEIGLTDGPIERADVLDAVGARFWPYYKGRDPERTPMPWSGEPGGGFSTPGVRAWLPMADPAACNVADQEGHPDSVLELCRRAIAARAASDDLSVGPYRSLASPAGTWAFERGDRTTVLVNLSDAPAVFDGVHGTVTVATGHALEGASIEGTLTLPAWSGAAVTR
jgi:alpha-glucosidase